MIESFSNQVLAAYSQVKDVAKAIELVDDEET